MPRVRNLVREFHSFDGFQHLAIHARIPAPALSPPVEIFQFDPEHGSLNCIKPEIAAQNFVVVFRPESVTTQQAQALGKLRAVGSDHSTVTESPKVLGREKAEAREIAKGA